MQLCGGARKSFEQGNMAEGDESAKLWKVNRTIHELVKDRVSVLYAHDFIWAGSDYS